MVQVQLIANSLNYDVAQNKYNAGFHEANYKVTWIKVFRHITGFGLHESKRLYELAADGGKPFYNVNSDEAELLKEAGLAKDPEEESKYVIKLEGLAIKAIEDKDYSLAKDIISLLKDHFS